jgi:fumarate reductase subunit D
MSEKDKHWLYRKENLSKLWIAQIVLLVLALIPEFFVHHHAHFEEQGIHVDASWGFFAWYGFLTCAAMVVGAKLLGFVLKRKDTYYDE